MQLKNYRAAHHHNFDTSPFSTTKKFIIDNKCKSWFWWVRFSWINNRSKFCVCAHVHTHSKLFAGFFSLRHKPLRHFKNYYLSTQANPNAHTYFYTQIFILFYWLSESFALKWRSFENQREWSATRATRHHFPYIFNFHWLKIVEIMDFTFRMMIAAGPKIP